MNDRAVRLTILALAIAFAVSPLLSNGFGGFYAESFPVQVDRWPAQPAGWAFSIWGLIYFGLILSAAWALWWPTTMPQWDYGLWPLGISLFLGIFWIQTAMFSPLLATAMILPMAAGAILAMYRVGAGWQAWAALGLYAGWLTAASGVAVSVLLTGYGIVPPRLAAILLIVLVLVVSVAVAAWRPHIWTYRAGVVWALIGVIAANTTAGDWLIVALCVLGIGGLVTMTLLLPNRRGVS